ncbi:glutathione S-transferase family protein [Lutimaribacter marinistellae]|uniref:Glutathione S-transferase family protein n=1 Tax=Lutimaribacter marinistellae TaxID=1820329 RepID=A0ABV7TC84_9RHOB
MYQIYGSPKTRALRVTWLLEELGQPYDVDPVGPGDAKVKELNGSGKVPVLVEGEAVLSDSTAIMTYLADKHGALTFPAGTLDRARQDALTHTILDEFDAILWTAARHSFVLPQDQRVPAIKESLVWEFSRNAARLAERFEGPFLMGETMTIADIICAHCLSWAKNAGFPIESEVLSEYGKAMRARPAFRRAIGQPA